MLIKITNENNGLSFDFMDNSDYAKLYGQDKTLLSCYDKFVNQSNSFIMLSSSGFFNNPIVTPFAIRGVNEDGINFKANSFSSKVITINFKNVFVNINNPLGFSPNNLLNSLLLNKNDILKVEVFTSLTFSNTFFVTEETETEQGLIVLESAMGGENIYWKGDLGIVKKNFFSLFNSYITKNLPQILLNKKKYPFVFPIISQVSTSVKFKIGGSKTTGKWESIKVENTQTGKSFTYSNDSNAEYVIVNSENLTVTDEFGNDTSFNFSGDFIFLDGGSNFIKWTVNDNENYEETSKYLPLNFSLEAEYTKYYSSIE